MRYFKRESGTIVRMDDNMQIYYLDNNNNWIHNQELLDMFIDELDYEEINEEEVYRYLNN